MTMAVFQYGKPLMVKAGPPGSSWNAGDVIVFGGVPFVAHEANPPGSGLSVLIDALAAGGGFYIMAVDAAYPNGQFVFWDSVLQQVTAQTGANRIPFGFIVGGPTNNLYDGGPVGSGTALVLHLPEPEMRMGQATFATGAFSSFGDEGNIYRAIGNPVAGNGADTTDDILSGIVLAANIFDLSGRGLTISIAGKLGATANNKRIKIWANPTMAGQTVTNGVISGGTVSGVGAGVLLFDSTVQTGNNVGFSILAQWFKYGANGSNTQFYQGYHTYGSTLGGVTLPAFSTIPENAQINLVITGSSPTTGAANDCVLNSFVVNSNN